MDEQIKTDNKKALMLCKLDMLQEILRITQITKFDLDEIRKDNSSTKETANRACEDFTSLFEKRSILFSKIKDIDSLLVSSDEANKNGMFVNAELNEFEDIKIKSKEAAEAILELDKRNEYIYDILVGHIKKSIKDINIGKKSTNLFSGNNGESYSRFFDQKK